MKNDLFGKHLLKLYHLQKFQYLRKVKNEIERVITSEQKSLWFCSFWELAFAIYFKGGLLMVPQKHREASNFIYNSGFFITMNEYPDFGGGRDGEAIKRRLKIFQTKTLKRKNNTVTGNCSTYLNNWLQQEICSLLFRNFSDTKFPNTIWF